MPHLSLKNSWDNLALAFLNFKPARYYFSSDKHLYYSIKNIFGFYPANIFLYKLAFLHKSAGSEIVQGVKLNNERLEFLGDAILDAIIADYLFKTFPLKDEGFLTEMRSKIVSRSQLNKLSLKLGMEKLIRIDYNSLNQYRSLQGDAFEALIGAIYLDKGYDFTKKVLLERIIKQYFDIDELITQEVNFKSRMIEWAQKEKKQISFQIIQEIGTGYKKQYIVELIVDGTPLSRGQDYSIKGAEQLASEKAWTKLNTDTNTLSAKND
jgi:ribonuclease III